MFVFLLRMLWRNVAEKMRPYSRYSRKLRINNRKKFNSGSRRVSWEFSPRNYPRKIVPFNLLLKRISKAERQGLTKEQMRKYIDAMV